jgi:glutathione S-transferase
MATPVLKLISFDLCPYVERSRIVLLEKDVPHQVEFIDLSRKPDWFLRISPMGRVPVLLVGDRPVFESMVINELLNELHREPPLFPADPLARAEARSWIVFANDVVMPAGYAAMLALAGAQDRAAPEDRLAPLREALGKLDAQVARGGGPYFAGAGFSLVDAAYAPFLRRWRDAEGWGIPGSALLRGFPALGSWADALSARPSVRAAEPPGFAARHRPFLAERAARAR